LISRIRNWENLPASDQAIQEVADSIKKIAKKHFGTTNKSMDDQEHGTQIRIRNIAKVLARMKTLQSQSRETFLNRKAQNKFDTLLLRDSHALSKRAEQGWIALKGESGLSASRTKGGTNSQSCTQIARSRTERDERNRTHKTKHSELKGETHTRTYQAYQNR
jgi:hypothetical protein